MFYYAYILVNMKPCYTFLLTNYILLVTKAFYKWPHSKTKLDGTDFFKKPE